jgi:hypothetical protein
MRWWWLVVGVAGGDGGRVYVDAFLLRQSMRRNLFLKVNVPALNFRLLKMKKKRKEQQRKIEKSAQKDLT